MEASTVKEVMCLVLRHTSILQRVLHSILASLLGLLMAHALRLACSRCSHIGARGLQASMAIYGLRTPVSTHLCGRSHARHLGRLRGRLPGIVCLFLNVFAGSLTSSLDVASQCRASATWEAASAACSGFDRA